MCLFTVKPLLSGHPELAKEQTVRLLEFDRLMEVFQNVVCNMVKMEAVCIYCIVFKK